MRGLMLGTAYAKYGVGGTPTDSSGTDLYKWGVSANVYVYPDPHLWWQREEGKINSIYMCSPSNYETVEAGFETNTSYYGKPPETAWAFAWYVYPDGTKSPLDPYWGNQVSTGTWHTVQVRYFSQAEGATYPNTISVWFDGVRRFDFTALTYNRGYLHWGSERCNRSTTLGGSFGNSMYWMGSSWYWITAGDQWIDYDPDQVFTDRLLATQHKAMVEQE